MSDNNPPGFPGLSPTWTSSAKSGIGTAVGGRNRVWFTLSHGILNEVYYPQIDQANIRDLGLLVTDGSSFFSEEKRHASHDVEYIEQGVPGYRLTNTCLEGRYRITKTVIADPDRDVVLQHIRFTPLRGGLSTYKIFALIAPHIDNFGSGNDGWVGDYKGRRMLFAQRGSIALALASSSSFIAGSCGYVGSSDGWQDVSAHKRMTWFYDSAKNGNIAMIGEVDLVASNGEFVLALGFGRDAAKAGHHAESSLLQTFSEVQRKYADEWKDVQSRCIDLQQLRVNDSYRVSIAVMHTCEARTYPGGIVASLSIPWGFSKGDEDLGGYHLVWTRDQVEVAGGFLAAGDTGSAERILLYLMATQEDDGHWPQNMWLDGTPYWTGIQMDETAFPIILADMLFRSGSEDNENVWRMVRKAASFILLNGPVTLMDRWEEDGGFSPFTLAVEITALLAAADFAERAGEPESAAYLRETADIWKSSIDRWTYVTDDPLASQVGVDGYYVRIMTVDSAGASSPASGFVPIKNRAPGLAPERCSQIVSPDALALVRFGIVAADDPKMRNTIKVIDALLKKETSTGPVWHRYNEDGYGEHEDGSPFDGTGVGRGWPLLAGERGHYELALGNRDEAERLLHVMEAQSSPGGLIPEQVWDAPDVPENELFNGKPAGSAMPLVWAHAEHVKLLRSLRDGVVFDLPPQTRKRYLVDGVESDLRVWRFNLKCRSISSGQRLRVEAHTPTIVHWSVDAWQTIHNTAMLATPWDIYYADLPLSELEAGSTIDFTLFEVEEASWEGVDYAVQVES